MLEEDEARPRREKLRSTRIHDLLLREGFDGSYDAVRRYAARWRQARRRDVVNASAFIPLLLRPGEAYQFDWSHEDLGITGKPMRVCHVAYLPVFPALDSYFERGQLGTGFGKAKPQAAVNAIGEVEFP